MLKLQSNKNAIASTSDRAMMLKVTTNPNMPLVLRHNKALLIDSVMGRTFEGFGIVLSQKVEDQSIDGIHYLNKDLDYLDDGDVIRVIPSTNSIRAIYRVSSPANFLLVTERCNSFCLMCSQPPRKINDDHLVGELLEAIPLIDRGAQEIGITGGEPTLLGDSFFKIIKSIRNNLPETSLHILTNGRNFADVSMAARLAKIQHNDLMLGIPLYSDIPHIHDFVVQADGAYDETIRGILNLKRFGQKVEIRVVIHKQTYKRLPQLAEFIGRNLQFVDHVALMGLEITGFTRANIDELWIDPTEYGEQLAEAVRVLARFGVKVSIYNLQRCIVPKNLWRYAVKSISDWKNKYYEECDGCSEKNNCGGFFASSDHKRSEFIKAI